MPYNRLVILLYVLLPLMVAYLIYVFDFSKILFFAFIFIVILGTLLTTYILRKHKLFLPLTLALIVVGVLSAPFWLPLNNLANPLEKIRAVYAFSAAKKNPHAFSAWWDYFVKEVVKANKVIHQDDAAKKLPHTLVANVDTKFHEGHIHINSLGFKGPEIPKNKGDAFRIITIGESTTFGQNVFANSQPWAEVLQELIDEKLDCNCRIQVMNFGVNAYVLKDGIELLSRNMDWAEPDVVLSYFGWNGVNDLGIDSSFHLPPIPMNTDKPVSRATFVYRQIQSKLSLCLTGLREVISWKVLLNWFVDTSAAEKQIWEQLTNSTYYKTYEQLVHLANKNRFALFLISFNTAVVCDSPVEAIQFYQGPFPGVRSTIQLMSYHNQMIHYLAKKNSNVYYVDSSKNILGQYDDDIFLDIVHFTPKGDRRMAHNIFHSLLPFLTNHPRLRCKAKMPSKEK